jgi:adhesin HecA-like repeat protein
MDMLRLARKDTQRGIVSVEAALVLPLLLLLTFALIEYGWMFLKAQQITNAARQGARVGAVPDAMTSEVQLTVDNIMNAAGMGSSGYSVTVSPGVEGLPRGEKLQVSVTVPYENIRLMSIPLIPVPGNLKAAISMAKEGP